MRTDTTLLYLVGLGFGLLLLVFLLIGKTNKFYFVLIAQFVLSPGFLVYLLHCITINSQEKTEHDRAIQIEIKKEEEVDNLIDLKGVVVCGDKKEIEYQDDKTGNCKQESEDTREENEKLERARECKYIGFDTVTLVVENEEETCQDEEKNNGEGNKNDGRENKVKEEDNNFMELENKASKGSQKKDNKENLYKCLNVELKHLITEANDEMTKGIVNMTRKKMLSKNESELGIDRATKECEKIDLTNVNLDVECKGNDDTVEGFTLEGAITGGCTSENNDQVQTLEKECNKNEDERNAWALTVTEDIKNLNGELLRLEKMCRIRGRISRRGNTNGQH